MRRGRAYQAAWQPYQLDMYSAVTQEGRSVGLEDHALVLALWAKWARSRVLWLSRAACTRRSKSARSAGPSGTTTLPRAPRPGYVEEGTHYMATEPFLRPSLFRVRSL
jgi:hypothetical protein